MGKSLAANRFYRDPHQVMDGLLIYRRADVQHDRFHARITLPGQRKYKVVALKAQSVELATQEALPHFYGAQQDLKYNRPLFKRTFEQVAKEFLDREKARTGLSGKGGITFHRWRVMDNHVK